MQTTPNAFAILGGMIPTGIGVGLTFPTLMGVAAGSLPPSSFSTGSGVVNMIRQAALAIGVAIFIAIIGAPETPLQRLHAFREGWWVMAGDRTARPHSDLRPDTAEASGLTTSLE